MLTPSEARAAGLDAGNRSMQRAGRVVWLDPDYAACWAALEVASLSLPLSLTQSSTIVPARRRY